MMVMLFGETAAYGAEHDKRPRQQNCSRGGVRDIINGIRVIFNDITGNQAEIALIIETTGAIA